MTKATLKRKLVVGFQSQRVRVHDCHDREHGSRQAGMVLEQ